MAWIESPRSLLVRTAVSGLEFILFWNFHGRERQDLSESLALPWAFFRLGAGIRHSMLKATQFVHGTPRLAASQRTCHLESMEATRPARMTTMRTFRPWQVYSFLTVSICGF